MICNEKKNLAVELITDCQAMEPKVHMEKTLLKFIPIAEVVHMILEDSKWLHLLTRPAQKMNSVLREDFYCIFTRRGDEKWIFYCNCFEHMRITWDIVLISQKHRVMILDDFKEVHISECFEYLRFDNKTYIIELL